MRADPQKISLEIWEVLHGTGRSVMAESDSALITQLLASLELPSNPQNPISLVIPTRVAGVALALETSDGHYTVSKASTGDVQATDAPIAIATRKGVLLVDGDDPLARARRSIANIDAIKF